MNAQAHPGNESNRRLTSQVRRRGFVLGKGKVRWTKFIFIRVASTPKHDVVINNRYRLDASNPLNSDAKRIYKRGEKTMSPIFDQQANLKVYIQLVLLVLKKTDKPNAFL